MKNIRSARLGFAAAIWLVLSVAVFGTLIGIAWMSMNATADVSTDAIKVDTVEEATSTQDFIFKSRGKFCYHTPAQYIGPSKYPIAPGCMLDLLGPSEYPIARYFLRD